MKEKRVFNFLKTNILKSAALILSFIISLSFVFTFSVSAEGKDHVVRVGWFESPFNQTDEYGRRSGYAYEYEQKIAAFTGWTYEYIRGSWPDLLEMLGEGKIDILADVSYTEQRQSKMLFSSLPMGAEEYYLYIDPDNSEISPENLSLLNGKKIGADKGSVQIDCFKEWAESNRINAEVIEMTDSLEDSIDLLYRGSIDLYLTVGGYFDSDVAFPVCKVGESQFYFAVSKERPELLDKLNTAMNWIQTKDPFYNQKLNIKYLNASGISHVLNSAEKNWISEHGPVRVGYQDNYLAFCAKDPKTGELTGALKDYLECAADCLDNAHIDFEAVAYPTASAAMAALENGEVDCMFPANLTDYDGEKQGYFMTAPLMRTDISAIILESEKENFSGKEHVTVAVNAGNPNYDMFLVDNFPDWQSVIFKDTPECLKAISEGKADCLLMSYFRYNNIASLCKKYGLTSVSTGVEMDYSFAVRRDSNVLYSIFDKINDVVPDSTINAALSYYFTEDSKQTFAELLFDNIWAVIAVSTVVILLIIALLLNYIHSRKRASERQKLITATELDPLTGLYNKNFFYEYADRMFNQYPDKPMDAVVLNIEQFHSVNATHGWDFGDSVIRSIGKEIAAFIDGHGGIAGHAEADRFAIYCPHLDDYNNLFERLQNRLSNLLPNTLIRLRMGIMPWEEGVVPRQQIEHALIACSMARGRYKEHIVIFDGHIREREKTEQRLKQDLKTAISEKQFEVHYQPKFDIRSELAVLCGVEALVRWNHPELGMIPPSDFIPLFEKNGQISLIDQFVWDEVVNQIAEWKIKYSTTVPVSVNLSRIDVFDPALSDRLDSLIEKRKLNSDVLKLEVTESAYAENSDVIISVIEKLHAKGYEIEMDDFGTGYSSLNLLSSMPIDVLKMDREFVKNIGRDAKDNKMIEVILNISKELNVPVIAEGVETEEQIQMLRKFGCEMVQGFYFSRPLTASEFEDTYLKDNHN